MGPITHMVKFQNGFKVYFGFLPCIEFLLLHTCSVVEWLYKISLKQSQPQIGVES